MHPSVRAASWLKGLTSGGALIRAISAIASSAIRCPLPSRRGAAWRRRCLPTRDVLSLDSRVLPVSNAALIR
ncbi:hypothetical protein IQ07DRAFT_591465 [Pyrenochaeta sp. DS3sAY3a]|nr:hypothetical protein IQ07DRAFT_591465 [Pyrenochaeta sp. DS3sAY3a]